MPNSIIETLYNFCDWISRLAIINILWLTFTILGLGLFGIMPATSALFAITRKWIAKEELSNIHKVFWNHYKKDFKKTNFVGIIFFLISTILALNFTILSQNVTVISALFLILTTLTSVIILLLFVNFFPVYAHYDLPTMNYFKHTLVITFIQPFKTFAMIMWAALVIYLSLLLPIMLPFFTISLIGIGMNYIAQKGFTKIRKGCPSMTS